jgi:pimeloyl-ACP methyl ester carboxylesterase
MAPVLRFLLLLGLFTASVAPAATPRIEEGELEGARFAIALPAVPWNRQVLLVAHGYRAPSAPLVAHLPLNRSAYATLLDAGWIVATTSYRRNGIILADAILDLDNLLAHLTRVQGRPGRVILEGDSMGGAIVTLLAERGDGRYAGAVAVGAALQVREPGGSGGVSFTPRTPLVFLTNRSELEGPRGYVERATAAAAENRTVVPPVLFRIDRDGHVNVNQAERLAALRALVRWLDEGPRTLPGAAWLAPGGPREGHNATVPPLPQPTRVRLSDDGRSFTATVDEVSAVYGNVALSAQPADFAAVGLAPGAHFELRAGERVFRVRYGRNFDSVPTGQWVAFPNADGFFWLARNQGNAAETAALAAGSEVTISRYPSTSETGP